MVLVFFAIFLYRAAYGACHYYSHFAISTSIIPDLSSYVYDSIAQQHNQINQPKEETFPPILLGVVQLMLQFLKGLLGGGLADVLHLMRGARFGSPSFKFDNVHTLCFPFNPSSYRVFPRLRRGREAATVPPPHRTASPCVPGP